MKYDGFKFWEAIRERLRQKGMHLKSLAEACGRSDDFIYNSNVRGKFPNLDDALMIAEALEVDVYALAEGRIVECTQG